MKFSERERETLLGPAIVGSILGLFAAACSVAFDSDFYRGTPPSIWSTGLQAILFFVAGLALALVPLGVAPVLIARFQAPAETK